MSDAAAENIDSGAGEQDKAPAPDPIFANLEPSEEQKPSGEPISIAPKQNGGRRNHTKAEFEKLDAAIKERDEKLGKELSARDAQIAQLTGGLQSLQQMLQAQAAAAQAQPQQRQAEQAADPERLLREAQELLDKQDINGYNRKLLEASRAETAALLAKHQQSQPQPQQPQGMPPQLMAMMLSFPAVATADDGMAWVEHKDRELAMQGYQPGPARVRKAFEEAAKYLSSRAGAQPQAPRFSTETAPVLTAVPTTRAPASAGREPGVRLSEYEKAVAKQVGMTIDEYAKHMAATHPERIER